MTLHLFVAFRKSSQFGWFLNSIPALDSCITWGVIGSLHLWCKSINPIQLQNTFSMHIVQSTHAGILNIPLSHFVWYFLHNCLSQSVWAKWELNFFIIVCMLIARIRHIFTKHFSSQFSSNRQRAFVYTKFMADRLEFKRNFRFLINDIT